MNPKAIVFDLDNTLTDRKLSLTHFAHRFYVQFGSDLHPIEFEQVEAAIQYGDQLGYKPKPQMFEELVRDLSWSTRPALETIRDFWYAESPACMQAREDAYHVLETLKHHGIRLGLITNGFTIVQNATIDAIGIRNYLDVTIISEEIGLRKPDPAIFHKAVAVLGVEPEQAWYVGDHPESDMFGASQAGLTGIWLRSGGHKWPAQLPSARHEIDELSQILTLLN
jgi:putative hydrolase of the HAD superfamily